MKVYDLVKINNIINRVYCFKRSGWRGSYPQDVMLKRDKYIRFPEGTYILLTELILYSEWISGSLKEAIMC